MMVDNNVWFVLPKMWIQFTGLSSHLQDYLIIWVVGAILGVTKDVDMVFTRRFDICRLQALVVNQNLIPQVVNVVIGNNLYELNFHVELIPDRNNPQPMEMDNSHEEGGADQRNDKGGNGTGNRRLVGHNVQVDGQTGQGNGHVASDGNGGKKLVRTYHIQVSLADDEGMDSWPGAQVLQRLSCRYPEVRVPPTYKLQIKTTAPAPG
jgi:hypothetical protein